MWFLFVKIQTLFVDVRYKFSFKYDRCTTILLFYAKIVWFKKKKIPSISLFVQYLLHKKIVIFFKYLYSLSYFLEMFISFFLGGQSLFMITSC